MNFINLEKILDIYKFKKDLILKYINELNLYFNNFYNKNIQLSHYYLLTQLPTKFNIYNHISGLFSELNDRYIIENNNIKNNLLITNYVLPHIDLCPIPFLFTDGTKYIISNIFYYEVSISKFRDSWDNETVNIGYGTIYNKFTNNNAGWFLGSIGYHSDDGYIYFEGFQMKKLETYSFYDTVGVGIEYIEQDIYKFFFTKNGKLLYKTKKLSINGYLAPIMGLEHSGKISVNFGKNSFIYDLSKYKKTNNNVLSTNNKFLNNSYNYNIFKVDTQKIINKETTNHYLEKIVISQFNKDIYFLKNF